jgi:hypothetical protein
VEEAGYVHIDLLGDKIMADDINDYGKFETFYKPTPKKEEEKEAEPVTPVDRPNPFTMADFGGLKSPKT